MASGSDLMAQVRTRPTTSTSCPSHPGQEVIFICKQTGCDDLLVCKKCVTNNHAGHTLADLEEYAASKKLLFRDKIKTGKDSILTLLRQNIESTEQEIAKNKTKTKEDLEKVKQRFDEFKEQLEKICQTDTESREETGSEIDRKLTTHKECLETLFTQHKAEMDKWEKTIEQGSDSEVVQLKERDFPTSPKLPTLPKVDDVQFTSRQLEELFEKLYAMKEESVAMATSVPASEHGATASPPQKIQQFVLNRDTSGTCHYLHSSSDQLYVWFNKSRTILLVKKNGEVEKAVTLQPDLDAKNDIQDVCVSPVDGTLWSVCYSKHSIRQVKQDGTSLHSFKQKCPALIYVTGRKSVLVGIKLQREVMKIFTESGALIKAISKYDTGVSTCPNHIAQCQKTGRVAMVGKKVISVWDEPYRRLRFTLHGETVTIPDRKSTGYKPQKRFEPNSICFDRDGDLLVCDINNYSIILFSSSGQYIRTIIQETDENKRPCAVTTAPDGTLWVAHVNDVFKQIKYK